MRFVVTAGPTREPLDPVRYLSNASSGRMGFELAAAAAKRGHRVALIAGPVSLETPAGIESRRDIVTALDLQEALAELVPDCDVLLMCAAVCDYRPARVSEHKIKRSPGTWQLALEPNPDLLAELAPVKGDRIFIGFALESENGETNARAKLERKGLDAIALNSPDNIGSAAGRLTVIRRSGGIVTLGPAPKRELAEGLVRIAEELASER